MDIKPLPRQTTWNDASATIDRNFETLRQAVEAIDAGVSVSEVAASAVRLTADLSGNHPVGQSVQESLSILVARLDAVAGGEVAIAPGQESLISSTDGLALVWADSP